MREARWILDFVCVFPETAKAAPYVFAAPHSILLQCYATSTRATHDHTVLLCAQRTHCDTCKIYTILPLEKQHNAGSSLRSKDQASTAC